MPRVRRTPVATTGDWQQREPLVRSPERRVSALIRPIVLFWRATGAPQRTFYRQPRRHDAARRDGAIGCGDA